MSRSIPPSTLSTPQTHPIPNTKPTEQRRLREDVNKVTNEGLHYDYDKAEDKSFRVVDSGTGKRKGAFQACVQGFACHFALSLVTQTKYNLLTSNPR